MKKGSFGMLKSAAIGLLVFGVVVAINADILDGFDFTADSYAANVTDNAEAANYDLSTWMDTIVIVIVAVVILGLLAVLDRR